MRHLSREGTERHIARIGLERARSASYAFVGDTEPVAYAPHVHSRHQLLYALSGAVRLEVDDALYVLPPQRAAFIPAGVAHVTIVQRARVSSVYLERALVPRAPDTVHVIVVPALLREMIAYASRWPPARDPGDASANAFFACLGLLCADWLARPAAARLPRGSSCDVRALVAYVLDNLCDATLAGAAATIGASPRTLRRKLQHELGTSFRALHAQARLVRAAELLGTPDARVSEVAFTVGYESLSAFTKSFRSFAGETPSAYRARAGARSPRSKASV